MSNIDSLWDGKLMFSVPERARDADKKRPSTQWNVRLRPREPEFHFSRSKTRLKDGDNKRRDRPLDPDPISEPEYCSGRNSY